MLCDLVNRCRPLPSGSRVLILGRGYSGRTLSQLFQDLGTPVLEHGGKPTEDQEISVLTVTPEWLQTWMTSLTSPM